MIEASECVICAGSIRRLRGALVAPFLARRIWNRAPFSVDLVGCGACGFTFYNPRLDTAEEGRLYANYRADEYRRMRHASEPWYTSAFNEGLASAASYDLRRRILAPILRQHLGGHAIRRVLDYGGDLVKGLIDGAEAFVYEISGIPPAEGVVPTADPAACRADLIINSNVLEHIGFPRRLVDEMLAAASAGGLVFLEVPCEFPFGPRRLIRRLAQIGIVALTRPALALSIARPSALYLMHEHVNYFSEQTLTVLLRGCGGEVVASGSYVLDGPAGKGPNVWCLGKRRKVRG
jgi:hypothetical protein